MNQFWEMGKNLVSGKCRVKNYLGGGNSNVFFQPYLGKSSNLTSIFFKGVETTN